MHYLSHLAETGAEFIHPGGRSATETVIEALELSDGMSVLDLGCGSAATLAVICRQWVVSAVGLDCLPEMLAAARQRGFAGSRGRAPLLVMGRAECLPFGDSVFDRVYSESVMGLLSTQEIRRAFREIHRVLKPHGIFIANDGVWKDGVTAETVRRINGDCINKFGLRQASEEPWTTADWVVELEQAGLNVESSELLNVETAARLSLISRAFRTLRKLRSLGSIRQGLRFMLYRRRLRSMVGAGQLLEGRIFVARRGEIARSD